MKTVLGISLVLIGLGIGIFVFYKNSPSTQVNKVFSSRSILESSWEKYKSQFINDDGRVLDHSQNDITTSEGQSYAMLRAVWLDDKETFDKVWSWSKDTLKRPQDNLFGWRWGQRADSSYGFLENGGENSASDADQDIALALIFASNRWNDTKYLDSAKLIITDIWKLEVDSANGKNYLVAGNWAKNTPKLHINPSYFSPFEWRIFAKVDSSHDWNSLIDPSYKLLRESGSLNLDKGKSTGLPPDWIAIDRSSGNLERAELEGLTTNYSYDAMRVPFRIALDALWFNEPQATDYLKNSFSILSQTYTEQDRLPSSFYHDGTVKDDYENPSMYATSLGYFINQKPELAKKIYNEKILKLYAGDKDTFNTDLPYYDQNWIWFGTALYNNFLINLYQE